MNEQTSFIINRIPSLTWNWLHMNQTDIGSYPLGVPCAAAQEIPNHVSVRETGVSALADLKTGMGENIDRLLKESKTPIHVLETEKNAGKLDPVRIDLNYEPDGKYADGADVIVADGTDCSVVVNYRSEKEAKGTAAFQTRYQVGKNARLTLIQVNYLGEGYDLLNDIGGNVDEGGEFRLIQLILGGQNNYYGAFNELSGKGASLSTDIGYIVTGDHKLDMNYVSNHHGKKTKAEINASGVLRGHADKLFRGTIDFHRGCGGAKGNEMEQVLLMDENVINRTIPVILCDEEDVEGNHGASIGRLDESLMFYLKSRGLSEEALYEMMAQARIDAVAAKIPDSSVREEVAKFLGEE